MTFLHVIVGMDAGIDIWIKISQNDMFEIKREFVDENPPFEF